MLEIKLLVYHRFPKNLLTFQDPEIVTAEIFPQRKAHPSLGDSFILISSMAGKAQGSGSVNTHSDAYLRTSRILTEVHLT